MKPDRDFDVAIVGGGLVGLSLARALSSVAGDRLSVALIDRSDLGPDGPQTDARASAVTAASRNLLGAIGVWDAVAEKSQPILEVAVTDSALDDGYRATLLSLAGALPSGAPGAYMIENEDLKRALLAGLRDLPRVSVFSGSGVSQVAPGGNRPRVVLSSGAKIGARLLVAADGRRSPVRAAAGIKTVSWSYPQTAIVTTVAHETPHKGRAVQHFLPAGPFAMLPLTGDRSSLVWTEDRKEAARLLAADDATFLDALTLRFGHQLGKLALAGPRASHPLDFTLARSLVGNRIALVGDAARGVHPLAGQGFNIGLKDVAALTECIVDGIRLGLDPGGEETLARYERWRRFDAGFSAIGMDAMNRLFSNSSRSLRAARDFGLELVDRIAPLKRVLVEEASGVTGEVPRLLKGEHV